MNTDAVPATLVVWGGVGLFIGCLPNTPDLNSEPDPHPESAAPQIAPIVSPSAHRY